MLSKTLLLLLSGWAGCSAWKTLSHTLSCTPFFVFFLSFFFFSFFLIFIIFKTNASERAETWFSLPFKATERHKARPVKSSSLNHAVREMGAAAPPNSSAVAWWTAPLALKIHPWAAAEVSSPAVWLNLQWLPPFRAVHLFVPPLVKVSSWIFHPEVFPK